MKPEFDREIEALLRGQKESARGGSARSPALQSAHMDADELSAYAENALPPVTRARYTAHLADCDDCRRIFSGVALASGVAVVADKRAEFATAAATSTVAAPIETGATKGLTGWLAALFSPRALRYAVPLLVVALTGVIAYVALRSREGAPMMAGRSDTQTQRPSAAVSNNTQEAAPATATTGTTDANTSAGGEADRAANAAQQSAAADKDDAASGPAEAARAKEAQSPTSALTIDGITSSQPREGATLADANKSADASAADTAAPAAAAPPPKASEYELRAEATTEDARRADNTKREADNLSVGKVAPRRVGDDEVPGDAKNETRSRSRPMTTTNRSAGAGARGERDAGDASANVERKQRGAGVEQEEAERRVTVAGYQFRRQGGVWVDVRFSGSMAASVIGRGSERFRTLAADFPELERITSQLSGTVVVILGGRAYRIN